MHYFFIGIAGTGMSAIAQYLKGLGHVVSGSDRQFGTEAGETIHEQFKRLGINCYPQDTSGINISIDFIVISTAIEENNAELVKARSLNLSVLKRSELLAQLSNAKRTIAIGGTSGKSTTTAMIFHILKNCNFNPSLITGAGLSELQKQGLPGNAWVGSGEWLVIESDESDGSIVNYKPEIAIVLNIDRDHKELSELMQLFKTFRENTKNTFIVNQDNENSKTLSSSLVNDFSTQEDSGTKGLNFFQTKTTIEFTVDNIHFSIPILGKHNMENALAAIAAAKQLDIKLQDIAKALLTFEGIYRRLQIVSNTNDIAIYDDFAHNPAEVEAAIKTLQQNNKRVFAYFQPHGFGPLRFMKTELIERTAKVLRSSDIFIVSSVYYAGGTVDKDINGDIIVMGLVERGANAVYFEEREKLIPFLKNKVQSSDAIVIMGARDTTLISFAQQIAVALTL